VEIAKRLRSPRCAIISDTNIAPLLADRVKQSLGSSGFSLDAYHDFRGRKIEDTGASRCDLRSDDRRGLDRESLVIGLGGGVVGDISGFVAAIFSSWNSRTSKSQRRCGDGWTAQSGKTGVNTAAGKNLIGAIHHQRS